ncbi:hypothetical protein [Intestinibacillus sp. Marseille-P6563]|uniref:hypothetical protein n=1 Tax=Intestinibacillus sp. Marseille-P6563 TaxID=2364792 RepID=UPI000F04E1AB|nr:hypothetical protein [Intestinibacillus sp. Marseille-P6563]
MYRKLCKYEFKSIARTLLPIYLAVIAVSIINAFSEKIGSGSLMSGSSFLGTGSLFSNILGLFQAVAAFAYFGVLVALFVLTTVVIIQRFYKGLLCDEGYLMFTLPVKTWHLVASKATVAFVMSVVSGIAAMISILILGLGATADPLGLLANLFDFQGWARVLHQLNIQYPAWPLYVIEFIVMCILTALAALFHVYVSMAIGHLARKHRVMMSVVAYIIISMALSFISGFVLILVGASNLYIGAWLAQLSPTANMHVLLIGMILWNFIELAVFAIGTERILSKKLNLE